jgi:hypothetical protein
VQAFLDVSLLMLAAVALALASTNRTDVGWRETHLRKHKQWPGKLASARARVHSRAASSGELAQGRTSAQRSAVSAGTSNCDAKNQRPRRNQPDRPRRALSALAPSFFPSTRREPATETQARAGERSPQAQRCECPASALLYLYLPCKHEFLLRRIMRSASSIYMTSEIIHVI